MNGDEVDALYRVLEKYKAINAELLAALQEWTTYYRGRLTNDPRIVDMCEKSSAAIAKAKGATP